MSLSIYFQLTEGEQNVNANHGVSNTIIHSKLKQWIIKLNEVKGFTGKGYKVDFQICVEKPYFIEIPRKLSMKFSVGIYICENQLCSSYG